MSADRLPKAVYNMLLSLDEQNKVTWVLHVKNLLFRYGFGHVFILQEVGDISSFIREFKTRVQDCFIQEWSLEINSSSKLKTYCTFKSMLEPEKYLDIIKIRKYRTALVRFRCSCHNLCIESGRRDNIDLENRVCNFCKKYGKQVIEDEYHFIVVCDVYNDLRNKYIPHLNKSNLYEFRKLFKTNDPDKICCLGMYIYNALILSESF